MLHFPQPAKLLLLASLGLALPSLGHAASVALNETLVDGNAADQFDPSVSGAVIVFGDLRLGGADLSCVDGAAPPLTFTGPDAQNQSAVSGNSIAFVDESAGNRNIHLFDIPSQTTTQLDPNTADDSYPSIDGNDVVFLSDRASSLQVHWQQIGGAAPQQISTGSVVSDAIDLDNGLAVWTEESSGSTDIVGTFLGIGPFSIASSASDERRPRVSGDVVAYLIDGDVEVYDLATGQRSNITNDPAVQLQVGISGDYVVFTDFSTGNLDVHLYVLSSGQRIQLTTDASHQLLGDIDGNVVVYEDDRLGNRNIWKTEINLTPDCGDGFLDAGEQCDDSNTNDGDCCSATCSFQGASGYGGMPDCCFEGLCQTGQACGLICFTPGGTCQQAGGPGTQCSCALP